MAREREVVTVAGERIVRSTQDACAHGVAPTPVGDWGATAPAKAPAPEDVLRLPHHASAYVPLRKVRDYLLSTSHSDGRSKARYFRSRGYDPESPWTLATDLRRIAEIGEVVEERATEWGTINRVDGTTDAPDGAPIRLTTIWIIGPDARPRLVTAYPLSDS